MISEPNPCCLQAVLVVLLAASCCQAGLLGAGEGEGSCAAAPFRTPVELLKWPAGCPPGAECCTEFGYCRSSYDWKAGLFRDCNGVSNGLPLSPETLAAEAAAGNYIAAPAPLVASYAPAPAPAPVAAYAPAPAPVAAYAPAPVAAYAPAAAPLPVASYGPVAASYAPAPAGYNYVY